MKDFIDFTAEVQKKRPESIKSDALIDWRENILNNEKERNRLTKIALKHQEQIKQNFLSSKLTSTKLTVNKLNPHIDIIHNLLFYSKNYMKFQ